MAVGKSTIGRALSQFMKFDFVDSDQEIEARTGADVSWIFDVEGEAGFRKREAAIIDELSQRDRVVLATGGGAVINPDNRTCLSGRGFVIHLTAPVKTLVDRTVYDKKRPILQQSSDRGEIFRKILAERGPLYESVADHTLNTENLSQKQIIRRLADAFRQWQKKQESE
jgi:shikimate kinase